jgi:hypothetical protein
MIQLYGNTMASFNDQIMGANSFRSPLTAQRERNYVVTTNRR